MAFALDNRGGGQVLPPYLQGRSPTITPKAATQPMMPPPPPQPGISPGVSPNAPPKITPNLQPPGAMPAMPPVPPVGGTKVSNTDKTLAPVQKTEQQTLYDFYKQDLENQRSKAMSGTTSNAAARGVYYGSPLTTSYGDINTEYLRGLGTLQANLIQYNQQDELQRMQVAAGLINSAPTVTGNSQGIDPATLQALGGFFSAPGQNPLTAGGRTGPVYNPYPPSVTPRQPGATQTV